MTLLQAIGEWFEELEVGVLGADLFLGERPSRPVAVTAVYLEGGPAADVYRPVERPVLRCLLRADTAPEALERAEALYDMLHGRENFPLGDDWWGYLAMAMRAPVLVGPSRPAQSDPGAMAECVFALTVRRA
jgi:hypothetical protein